MRKKIIIAFLVILSINTKAQYFYSGVEPFAIKWQQISHGDIRLIYPSGSEAIANKYLQIISTVDTIVGKNYRIGKSKLDVILHCNSILSNGFVSWAPRRMELVTQPAFNSFAQLWSYQLATHEMQHVKQMYALNRKTIKAASYIFGQQATGLAAGFIPLWFLEGDAVIAETAHSHSGRGRLASFYQHYRIHSLTKTNSLSYDKLLLGSFKDYIPNHYSLGYQIVAYGNLKYGENLWANTIDYVTRRPYTVFPFYFGLKKETGLSRKKFAERAFEYQDSAWNAEIDLGENSILKPVACDSKEYSNYIHPTQINDSTIVAYKTSLPDIPSFVMINTNTRKESLIVYPGYIVGKPFINDSVIVWSEFKAHTRWEYKNYGQIVRYNFKREEKFVFPQKGMYGSPIIDSDSKVICIAYKPKGGSNIVFLEESGDVKNIYSFPIEQEPFELAYNKYIYVGVTTQQGKMLLQLKNNSIPSRILGPAYWDINSLQVKGDTILFSATNKSKENIYFYNILTDNCYSVLNSTYSLNYPFLNNDGSLVFSSYSALGYKINRTDSLYISSKIDIGIPINDAFTKSISENASYNLDTLSLPMVDYPSKPYKGIGALFNFHSWAPFYFNPFNSNPEETSIKLGGTIMSQNLTGSTILVLGYGYANSHLFRGTLRYQGFWPVFSLSYELFDYPASIYSVSNDGYLPNVMKNRTKLYSFLPFYLSNNSISTYLQLFNNLEFTNDYLFDRSIQKYRSGLFIVNYGVYFHSLRKQSHRDLLPKYGVTLTVLRQNAPYSRSNIGSLWVLKTNVYIPGLLKNQHFKMSASLQDQNLEGFPFSNKVDPPRGYLLSYSKNYLGFSFDYILPLAYPDRSIGSLAYIKRLSLDLFYDYAKNSYPYIENNVRKTEKQKLQSLGFELNIDFHLFRTRYPFRMKYQQAFLGRDYRSFSNFSLLMDIYGGIGARGKFIEH